LKFIVDAFAIFALDDEMLDLMVGAGCIGINVAIESGNQRVMNDIVLKPIKLDSVPPLIKKIRERGLFVISNFIIGFPGETWHEIRKTISFAENCGADYVKFFIAVPLKGTKLWDTANAMGAIGRDTEEFRVDWRFSQITSDEWSSEDVSVLRAFEWDRINFGTPEQRKRMSDLWGIDEGEMFDLRKKTRDAVTLSGFGASQSSNPV
ncbi:MAG: radical SAM protein, partial [Rhodospirillales bacterium]|nr:radical SAM protein [Rhodospirillales bacterium]